MENIKIEKSCAFSGHRILEKSFNVDKLEEVINSVLKNGFNRFLIGMAKGFDSKCFDILIRKKQEYDIKIIACVPCKEQDKYFTKSEKEDYKNRLDIADEVVYISDEYTQGCMQQRNRFMVDNSSILIAYLKYPKGGTVYTANYAKKKEKQIIFI